MLNKPFKIERPNLDPLGVYTHEQLLAEEERILISSGTKAITNAGAFTFTSGALAVAEATNFNIDPSYTLVVQAGLALYATYTGVQRVTEVVIADNNRTAILGEIKNNPFTLIPATDKETELFTLQN